MGGFKVGTNQNVAHGILRWFAHGRFNPNGKIANLREGSSTPAKRKNFLSPKSLRKRNTRTSTSLRSSAGCSIFLNMDEGRKRTILIAASILVARKWDQLGARPSPALDAAISDAISLAERTMQKIDNRSRPSPPDQSMNSSAGYPWKDRT